MAFAPMLMRCSGKGGKARGIGVGPDRHLLRVGGGGRKAEICGRSDARAATGGNFFLDAWSRTESRIRASPAWRSTLSIDSAPASMSRTNSPLRPIPLQGVQPNIQGVQPKIL